MSGLPPSPDFAAINAAAPLRSGQRNILLGLIGTISFCWSNNESLLVYFIMLLCRVDERTATVIFDSLATSRARLDLIEKLAILHIDDLATHTAMKRVFRAFSEETRKRNELLHSIYHVDQEGQITHLKNMRVQVKNGCIRDSAVIPLDSSHLRDLAKSVKKLRKINEDMWALLRRIEAGTGHQQHERP
jgi:hypothetical protein